MLPGLAGPEEFALDGQRLTYIPEFLSPADADQLFEFLSAQIPWEQPWVQLYGRRHPVPRLLAWQGDAGIHYAYSGLAHPCSGWQPPLASLRDAVAERASQAFNFVLLNLYRDGRDAMGWHRDDETQLGRDPLVASLSLGGERDFRLRDAQGKTQGLRLQHGSLLLMPGRIAHCLPRRAGIGKPRINLSWRQIRGNAN